MNRTDTLQRLRTDTFQQAPKELAYRETDGIEVWLLWSEDANRLFVLLHDSRLDDSFELDVQSANALDCFEHPYAYAAFRGIDYRTPQRAGEALCA